MMKREKDEVKPKIKKEVMDTTTEDMNESTAVEDEKPKYSELIKTVNEIARPLAGKKLTKALFKTARKGIRFILKVMYYLLQLATSKLKDQCCFQINNQCILISIIKWFI